MALAALPGWGELDRGAARLLLVVGVGIFLAPWVILALWALGLYEPPASL